MPVQNTIGIDALLPLERSNVDLYYELSKTINDNVKQNLKMLLYTAPGERIMVPAYGVGLKNFLFENFPEIDIAQRIQDQVRTYLPQIRILSLAVQRGDQLAIKKVGQANTLTVQITYEIYGYNVRDTLVTVDKLPG